MTRQQQRNIDRRADKPEPGPVQRTSARHMGRTKGQPYSRAKLVSVTPATRGKPAVFNVKHHTRNVPLRSIDATYSNIDWFFKGLTFEMRMAMLGQ